MLLGKPAGIFTAPTHHTLTPTARSRDQVTITTHPVLDVAIDGADEVDPELDLVKGRGGALLREKMIEQCAAQFICIVDESKLVDALGGSKGAMPVEVTPYCWEHTQRRYVAHVETVRCCAFCSVQPSPFVANGSNSVVCTG